ncbi:Surfeit locus protein 6 [Quillaja saponaria]|uniref:Surfeit locus protein 6 n=1 Tax=Quillaja saponaria TaxID=32244 RepID=A0AAD7LF55_QUISA|nr:Surfeit locus protein 6 [Quillaja saponaria]
MKKKKQKLVADAITGLDLKSTIHQHCLFFDKLVELIPAKFYLPVDAEEKPWFQGLSKAKKASAKKETKENIKKARKNRLDPEKSSATTLDVLKERLEKDKLNKIDEEEIEMKPQVSGMEGDNRSVTYEELRQRLRHKIEEFRAVRNSGNSNKAEKRNERSEKREIQLKKRKRDTGSGDNKTASGESVDKAEKDAAEASKGLMFSHVKLVNDEKQGKKKRKLSKVKELERAKKLEEAKNDPEKGDSIAQKLAWKTAMSRARGIKVHDDPKLLKKSLQKEKKRHEKNAEKWKGRVETREHKKAEKQKKRSENISERIQQKKMRQIAKREKKLMLRSRGPKEGST